ncbi:MAG: class I SAM-dependent methyltransferase [Oscillospiraceae bacterium]|nr:class I SAM-dependent methyltransferase [Oscillospiraceae bacterium]
MGAEETKAGFGVIAKYYDALNIDADYKKVADYIEGVFSLYQKKPESILDLACGTGNLAIELSNRGYDMTGLDLSAEMLAAAAAKKNAGKVLWTNQDMVSFELYGTVDAALCCFDSLNYVADPGDVKKCFALARNYLNPGGLFVFDVNSKYKFESVYANNSFILEDAKKKVFCIWQNRYRKKDGSCDFYITLFAKQPNGGYMRHEEAQREKYHSPEFLERALLDAGFGKIGVFHDFRLTAGCIGAKIPGRICFAAQRL